MDPAQPTLLQKATVPKPYYMEAMTVWDRFPLGSIPRIQPKGFPS